MEKEFAPTRLDMKALAQSGSEISGQDMLSRYERLTLDLQGSGPDLAVKWSARGESRTSAGANPENWLHLTLETALPLICQRCMGPVSVPVSIQRSFRFVASEAEALAQDEEAEEDLLVMSREFNLAELIEDELLMAVPMIPRHEVCPTPVKLAAADPGFEDSPSEKPNPFAALANLKITKPDKPG